MSEAFPSEQLPASLARFVGFLQHDPSNLSLRCQTVATALQLQQWHVATSVVEEGLRLHPNAPELLAHAGFLALRNNDYLQAEQDLSAASAAGMTAAGVIYNLAFARFQLKKFDAVVESTSALLARKELTGDAGLLQARALHYLGKLDDAIALLESIQADVGERDDISSVLSLLLYEVDRNDEALVLANQVLSGSSAPLEALLARGGSLVEMNRFDEARVDYERATALYPNTGRAWSGLAQVAFHDMQLDQALSAVEHAVQHMPDHIGTWHIKGWIHILQPDVAAAKHCFDKAYELDRNFGETHGGLAVCYAMTDEVDSAERHIKLAQRLDPLGFSAIYAQMLLLKKQGKSEAAEALFNQVMNTVHAGLGVAPNELVKRRLEELAERTPARLH